MGGRVKSLRERRSHEGCCINRTGRFAKWGYVSGISAKLRYVFPHPLQSCKPIKKDIVAGTAMGRFGGVFGMGEEAHNAKPVINGDKDDAVSYQGDAIIAAFGSAANAAIAFGKRLNEATGAIDARYAGMRWLRCAAHSGPSDDRLRRTPAQRAQWRPGEGNPLKTAMLPCIFCCWPGPLPPSPPGE